MKKITLLFIVAILFYSHNSNCQDKKLEKENAALKAKIETLNKTAMLAARDHHGITYKIAKDLILPFVQDYNLSPFARAEFVACYLRKDLLETLITNMTGAYPGLMLYLCYPDITIEGVPKYFIAFKNIQEYNRDDLSLDYISPGKNMYTAIHYRTYNKAGDMAGVENFMENDAMSVVTTHGSYREDDVKTFFMRFRDNVKDASGNIFNKYPYGFFNKTELIDLLKKEPAGPEIYSLKLFLGLDGSEEHSRIRIILAQCDIDGKVIFKTTADGRKVGKFIERSYP